MEKVSGFKFRVLVLRYRCGIIVIEVKEFC